ncbi:MAG: hypothetical protein AAF773_13485 [Cyanobacteria bacterium P01_D01_bin.115]
MVSSLRQAIALWLIVLTLGLAGCGGDRDVPIVLLDDGETVQATNPLVGVIAEVSPPERIQQLKPYLDVYEPQVRITSPRNGDTLQETAVAVELQVRDLPIYIDQDLGLGPHLHLFLDDQPFQAIYDAESSLTLADLAPGTHTLRVFAVRPWGESFKNEEAYDQVTFDVFAASPNNNPDDSQALLTYSQPQGSYGAEPIMLDFYLTNAPLHWVAEADESMRDWRIRCTVNGESFVFDRWQPIYLKGFNPGKNWVKLELIDENGRLIDNALNTGIRVIDYNPGGEDALSQLIRGEIPLAQAKVLVDPNYVPPAPLVKERPELQPETLLESESDNAPEPEPIEPVAPPDIAAPPTAPASAPSAAITPSAEEPARADDRAPMVETVDADEADEALTAPAPLSDHDDALDAAPDEADRTIEPDELGPAADSSSLGERETLIDETDSIDGAEPTALPADEISAESSASVEAAPEATISPSGLAVDDLTEDSLQLDSPDPNLPDDLLNDLPSETISPDLPDNAPAKYPPEPALESLEAEADLV